MKCDARGHSKHIKIPTPNSIRIRYIRPKRKNLRTNENDFVIYLLKEC